MINSDKSLIMHDITYTIRLLLKQVFKIMSKILINLLTYVFRS